MIILSLGIATWSWTGHRNALWRVIYSIQLRKYGIVDGEWKHLWHPACTRWLAVCLHYEDLNLALPLLVHGLVGLSQVLPLTSSGSWVCALSDI